MSPRNDLRTKRRRAARQAAWDTRHPLVCVTTDDRGSRITLARGVGKPRLLRTGYVTPEQPLVHYRGGMPAGMRNEPRATLSMEDQWMWRITNFDARPGHESITIDRPL